MDEIVYKIVRRMFRDEGAEFSRNRNFSAYEDPMVQRARRIFRHLASVEAELEGELDEGTSLESVVVDGDRIEIHLRFERAGARRTSILNHREWALLLENSASADALIMLAERAGEQTRAQLERALATLRLEPR